MAHHVDGTSFIGDEKNTEGYDHGAREKIAG